MPAYTCPHCRKPFRGPSLAKAAKARCPHCRHGFVLPKPSVLRWYYARAKKKYGPYSWQQILAIAERGELGPDDMLLQEGGKRWLRAATVPGLFADGATAAPPAAEPPPHRGPSRWLVAGLVSGGIGVLLGVAVLVYVVFGQERPADSRPVSPDKLAEQKRDDPKADDIPRKKKDEPHDVKVPVDTMPLPRPEWTEQFLVRLNKYRNAAGLASVALDAELSRACRAHAGYLALHFDPAKPEGQSALDEDPKKSAYSTEGQNAAKNAMVAFAAPAEALEIWLGKLAPRASLLAPEMKSIGLGVVANQKGEWICVVDARRGRGEPVIVYPAPKQVEVPIAFTGGPEVPDAKAAAGFPITVSFPLGQQIADGKIDLRDAKGNVVDGWTWESPKKANAIALIPKGLLQGDAVYQVKASAQRDGKQWDLTWSFTTADERDRSGAWAKAALEKLNAYRLHAGLAPVTLDGGLSRGCLAHARYLVINDGHVALQGLGAHDEDLSLPGASAEGKDAGLKSNIAMGDYEPTDGIDAWMATLYHRVPMLEPNLKTIGFACVRGGRQGWVTVMNVTSGRADAPRPMAVFYPAPDQADVRLSFPNGGEEPNPIPDDKTGRAGYPITAFFPKNESLTGATGKLTNANGIPVPCWFSSADKPANPKFAKHQGNTVCLIPKEPLAANTTFHVQFQGQRGGQAWERNWQFTTGAGGLTPAAATKMVVERMNLCRSLAGLGSVSLDAKLSYGCQLHAEYLARNTETLARKNASVNDEDVNLPGFTREGLRSAQQSLIFTNAPVPVFQIDDLMATAASRRFVLDPALQRIGFGCAHDLGRGWRCVLDINGGRGDSRVVVFPSANQADVPLTGSEPIDGKPSAGFPISVAFPRQASLRNPQAELADGDKIVAARVMMLDAPQPIVGVVPNEPLRPGRTYTITIGVVNHGIEWRETWQFTTAKP